MRTNWSRERLLRLLSPVFVLAGGIVVWATLVTTKPQAKRKAERRAGTLVEVMRATYDRHEVSLEAKGSVIPAKEVALQPEISGKVAWVSPKLVPGSRVEAGVELVRLEQRQYELAIEAQRVEVERARLELETEEGRQRIAKREWEIFQQPPGEEVPEESKALALREPQLRTAKVALESAQSSLERSKLDLQRTHLSAPFSAVVLSEAVDVGMAVSPQSQLARLVGDETFRVQVSVPVEALSSLRIPGIDGVGPDEGAQARISHQVGGRRIQRNGRVVRLFGDLDPVGSLARLLVEVDSPLSAANPSAKSSPTGAPEKGLPLLLGAYVSVDIDAEAIEHAVRVPRGALRENDSVFVVDGQSRLRTKAVQVAWRLDDAVLVVSGVDEDEAIVVSPLPAPVDGMLLRISKKS